VTDVVDLRKARAAKTRSSKDWTAEDMLEEALQDIRNGAVRMDQVALHYLTVQPNETVKHGAYCVNMKLSEHVALLNVALKAAIEDWCI